MGVFDGLNLGVLPDRVGHGVLPEVRDDLVQFGQAHGMHVRRDLEVDPVVAPRQIYKQTRIIKG